MEIEPGHCAYIAQSAGLCWPVGLVGFLLCSFTADERLYCSPVGDSLQWSVVSECVKGDTGTLQKPAAARRLDRATLSPVELLGNLPADPK